MIGKEKEFFLGILPTGSSVIGSKPVVQVRSHAVLTLVSLVTHDIDGQGFSYVSKIMSGDPARGMLSLDTEEDVIEGQWAQVCRSHPHST